ncbi:MAG TPA: hypothetical protein VLM85_31485, partial [Polyangiaceae bacterium]|nr:hypothetical protein [Polyangiaceae bacterium]
RFSRLRRTIAAMASAPHTTGVPIAQVATVAVALAAGVVYGLHVVELPVWIGLLAACSALFGMLPVTTDRARLAVAAAVVLLGLGIVWVAAGVEAERTARLLRNLGGAQALLGLWQSYVHGAALRPRSHAADAYGPAALARWRSGDLRFGLELASRVVVRAQPSWVALVLETAWPEPRPAVVAELLSAGPDASEAELRHWLDQMNDKGGTDRSEARWELARLACEVSIEARSRPPGDVGGVAASRFVVAASAVDGDDERMAQIFSALVVPAVANPTPTGR